MAALYQDDAYLKYCEAEVISADENGIRLSDTVFYPTGGGQPGDSGKLVLDDGSEVAITDARKGDTPDDVLHIPATGSVIPQVGSKLTAHIDWDRRYRHMQFHTAMHILCSLIEGDVTGGNLSADKARLDFNLPDGPPDKVELTSRLNQVIQEAHPVSTKWITDDELDTTLELVRTMSVAPPRGFGRVRLLNVEGVDLQACGGTHIKNTSEIGELVISKIENKGRQNRRFTVRFQADM